MKNLFCKIFGHKIISRIYNTKWDSEIIYSRELEVPICKRCGITLKQMQEEVKKK